METLLHLNIVFDSHWSSIALKVPGMAVAVNVQCLEDSTPQTSSEARLTFQNANLMKSYLLSKLLAVSGSALSALSMLPPQGNAVRKTSVLDVMRRLLQASSFLNASCSR